MEHHALASLLRRSGPQQRRRTLLVFYCLRHVALTPPALADQATTEDDSGTALGTRLSLDTCVNLTYSVVQFDRMPPRFVFATGTGGVVLRSGDRGLTWRRVTIHRQIQLATAAVMPGLQEVAGPTEEEKADMQLRDILALLPAQGPQSLEGTATQGGAESDDDDDADGEVDVVHQPQSPSRPLKALVPQPDLHGICCFQDTVAVVGVDGLIAVSADRGSSFQCVPPSHLAVCRDRTKSKHEHVTLRDVSFVDACTVVFRSASSVFTVRFSITGMSRVAFAEPVRLVFKCKRCPVGCVRVLTAMNASSHSHLLCISSKGMLHFSADSGSRFITVPHQLGLIRCLELLPSTLALTDSRVRHPSLNEALTAVGLTAAFASEAMQDHAPPSLDKSMEPESKSSSRNPSTMQQFSYALTSTIGLKQDEGAAAVVEALFSVGGLRAGSSKSSVRGADSYVDTIKRMERDPSLQLAYLRCAVLGTDGRVVPYDFTATLHILIRAVVDGPSSTGVSLLCHSTASQVDYLPFVQSLPSDAAGLCCFDVRDTDSSQDASHVVLVRSTSSGISVSYDMGSNWTAPTRAFTGTVRQLDEGSFVVASSRSCIVRSDDGGKSCCTIAIPSQLRVPVVTDLDVMR